MKDIDGNYDIMLKAFQGMGQVLLGFFFHQTEKSFFELTSP